jgi:presenilin-like A22 family membrane protease
LGTILILLAIKFLPDNVLYWVFKGIEALAIFSTALIVFFSFVPEAFAILLAVGLVVIRIFAPQYLIWRNVSSVVATIGAGSLIGVSAGVLPVIVFLVLLAVYDYIAVFKTKHMVTMAKAVAKKNLAFTFALPTKEHQFELGTGDLVMPLVFSVAVMKQALISGLVWPAAIIPSIAILVASFAGLWLTLDYGNKHVGKALPALPLQVALMVLMYGVLAATGIFG